MEEAKEKIGFGSTLTFPVLSIIDPELMVSIPPHLTATGRYLYNKRMASRAYKSLIGVAQFAKKPSAAWKKQKKKSASEAH